MALRQTDPAYADKLVEGARVVSSLCQLMLHARIYMYISRRICGVPKCRLCPIHSERTPGFTSLSGVLTKCSFSSKAHISSAVLLHRRPLQAVGGCIQPSKPFRGSQYSREIPGAGLSFYLYAGHHFCDKVPGHIHGQRLARLEGPWQALSLLRSPR